MPGRAHERKRGAPGVVRVAGSEERRRNGASRVLADPGKVARVRVEVILLLKARQVRRRVG
jgi:hypothetical protein